MNRYEEEKKHGKTHFLNKYSLFKPRTLAGLKRDYPELRRVPEFNKLSKNELLLAWYYGCEASPLSEIQDKHKRMSRAIFYAYEKDGAVQLSKDVIRRYEDLELPHKLEVAIEKMAQYRMGPRVRQKKMVDKILNNFEKIISMDVEGPEFKNEDGEVDFDKVKKYVDASVNVSKNMDKILAMAEGSFGIYEEEGEDQDEISMDGDSLMDSFHENND